MVTTNNKNDYLVLVKKLFHSNTQPPFYTSSGGIRDLMAAIKITTINSFFNAAAR
jgi:hypothetical protein